MLKRLHSLVVYESRLVKVLDILNESQVKIRSVKNIKKWSAGSIENQWYVSMDVTNKKWSEIIVAIYKDPQVGGACCEFE